MYRYFFIVALIFPFVLSAQPGRERKMERVESFRTAYITQQLNLTPEEAQRFWPIYNQFTDAMKANRQQYKPKKELADMSDAEAEQLINSMFEQEQKAIALKKDYFQKLKSAIPVKKIAKLHRIEQEFKAEILKKAKEDNRSLRQGMDDYENNFIYESRWERFRRLFCWETVKRKNFDY